MRLEERRRLGQGQQLKGGGGGGGKGGLGQIIGGNLHGNSWGGLGRRDKGGGRGTPSAGPGWVGKLGPGRFGRSTTRSAFGFGGHVEIGEGRNTRTRSKGSGRVALQKEIMETERAGTGPGARVQWPGVKGNAIVGMHGGGEGREERSHAPLSMARLVADT